VCCLSIIDPGEFSTPFGIGFHFLFPRLSCFFTAFAYCLVNLQAIQTSLRPSLVTSEFACLEIQYGWSYMRAIFLGFSSMLSMLILTKFWKRT